MDRASDFGSEGWGFESLRARFVYKGFTHPTLTQYPLVGQRGGQLKNFCE
jgi:hypothetical protein